MYRLSLYIGMIIICLGCCRMTYGQSCHAEISDLTQVSEASVLSPVIYKYTLKYDKACKLNVTLNDKGFRRCDEPVVQTDQNAGSSHVELTCVYLKNGYFYTPPVMFEMTDGDQRRYMIAPDNREIGIRLSEYRPESGNIYTFSRWSQRSVLPLTIILTLLLFCILIAAYFYYYKVQMRRLALQAEQELLPLDAFKLEMNGLLDNNPDTVEAYQLYHDRLSHALRRYVTQRFAIDAFSLTTCQLVEKLLKLGVKSFYCNELRRLLEASDRVKFARDVPNQGANLTLLRDAGLLVTSLDAWNCQDTQNQPQP